MLIMPTNFDKSDEQQTHHFSQHQHQQHTMRNLLFDSDQLTAQCYARGGITYNTSPKESAVSAVHSSVCTSPLEQLIKFQESFQQKEFSSSSSSAVGTATTLRCSSPKMPLAVAPLAKTLPAISTNCPTSFSETKSVSCVAPQESWLDSPSLVLSTYANATQLAGPMVAAAAAQWAPSAWQWSAAAAETAALLNGTYGGGTTTEANSAASNGGWNGAYFGNAFGGLMSNQFGCFSSNNQQQIIPSTTATNCVSNSLATTAPQRNETAKKANNGITKQQMAMGTNDGPTVTNAQPNSLIKEKLTAKGPKHRAKAGGKMKSKSGAGKGGGSNNCECPNCKDGIPLHNCHIPGCHKKYDKSSHLKAHLKWHKPERSPVTKKRLFDPPNNLK